ncbi:MAG TPA: NADH-quinone oxidoreductase subunit A [Candidatus Sulfotelmatobacter sp.]|jgi:NADH-quinone oxidoreductase subunit A|nr:NADH-quinone oxidoreductase subunit A [Candidatus Sulfotelmatobacter sp.]
MEGSLITVLLTVVTAVGMIVVMLLASWLAPKIVGKRWSRVHSDTNPYECGARPFEPIEKHRFSVKFYLVAMLFILFDVEAAFLIPWAVTFRGFAGQKLFVLGEMAVFLGILLVGLVYLWWRGALEWE